MNAIVKNYTGEPIEIDLIDYLKDALFLQGNSSEYAADRREDVLPKLIALLVSKGIITPDDINGMATDSPYGEFVGIKQ